MGMILKYLSILTALWFCLAVPRIDRRRPNLFGGMLCSRSMVNIFPRETQEKFTRLPNSPLHENYAANYDLTCLMLNG